MKRYISKKKLDEFVKEISCLISQSDVRKLQKIAKDYSLILIGDRQTNLNKWWMVIVDKLESLQVDDKFRKRLIEEQRWRPGRWEREEIWDFIRYLKVWDEYEFLSKDEWKQLDSSLFHLCSCFEIPRIGTKAFFEAGGDMEALLSRYTKENADPEALKLSKKLKQAIDNTLKGLPQEDLSAAAQAINSYVYSNLEMDEDEFHNALFSNR